MKKSKKIPRIIFAIALLLLLSSAVLMIRKFIVSRSQIPVPPEVTEFVKKYPQASAFARDFPTEYGRPHIIDVTSEMEAKEIPLFFQWDKRWGYEPYGDEYIGTAGCGPTSLSMVVCGLTGSSEWTPDKVAKFSDESGYYVENVGTAWDLMTIGAGALGLLVENGSADADYIYGNLTPRTPIIASMLPGDFTYTGHFIVLTGIDENGKLIVNDCNSPANSETHWDPDVLIPQICALWKYSAA